MDGTTEHRESTGGETTTQLDRIERLLRERRSKILLSIDEMADDLSLSVTKVKELMKRGVDPLPTFHIGRRRVANRQKLIAWAEREEGRQAAARSEDDEARKVVGRILRSV